MTKRRIAIDIDLWEASKNYVEAQLATIRKFQSAPKVLSPAEYDDLVYRCAEYQQRLRKAYSK